MFKIEGLDKIQKELSDAQRALESLDGELGTVKFDPTDPGSIEAAIEAMETLIDEKTAEFSSNSIVMDLAQAMKDQYRNGIVEQAAAARMDGTNDGSV